MDEKLRSAYELFHEAKCSTGASHYTVHSDTTLQFVDEDKMRCHIINCIAALHMVQMHNQKVEDVEKYESVKRKVFRAAILMIIDKAANSDEADINAVISAFPDIGKMYEERSWRPMHFAIALAVRNKISEDDLYILLSEDPLAMHGSSNSNIIENYDYNEDVFPSGCSPTHILCMHKQPKMSLLRYFRLRDPRAFVLCDHRGRCALHLVAQYSESLELLQCILQIDHKMTKMTFELERGSGEETTPLGLLCRRLEFPTFDRMLSCLIELDSSVEVICDGVTGCFRSYFKDSYQDVASGSRGGSSLILLRKLLDTNPAVVKYENSKLFHVACKNLRGELGMSVLSLLLSKDSTSVKVVKNGSLPIHVAAEHSCLDVLKFLQRAYPESFSMLGHGGRNLLHLAALDSFSGKNALKTKVQYLCDQWPALIHLKDTEGCTPLQLALTNSNFNYESLKILCNADEMILREECPFCGMHFLKRLPLHCFIAYHFQHLKCTGSEISDKGDCFRLLLRLYPAAASVKDTHSESAYDEAVSRNLRVYFIRLLLQANPSIDPVERHNLNYAARRQGMFLAFGALSSNAKPIIWAKLRFEDRHYLELVLSYL